MMNKTIIKEGVVAEFNGKYWGTLYDDGQSRCEDFVSIEKAKIVSKDFCHSPTGMTYSNSPDFTRLFNSKLKNVKITTTYEVED